jgi:hypothetical protein
MPISGYFDKPFAIDGTRTTVPDGVQPDGSISYDQGYGVNYTLQPGTSGALNVDNATMNQVFYDITSAIQYQQQGLPAPFITSAMNGGSPFPYAQYAMVVYNGVAYQSNANSNTDTPPSSKWNPVVLSSPNTFIAGTSTGSANAQVLASLSPSVGFSTAVNGQSITFTPGFTNTGSTTLAVTSPTVSATIIKKESGGILVALTGGELATGVPAYVTWNLSSACWVLTAGPALGTIAPLNIGNNMANDGNGNAVATIPPTAVTGASHTFTTAQWGALLLRSNSGSAMTDTLPGTIGELPAGWCQYVQNDDATASDTISAGSGGTIYFGNSTPASITVRPGERWQIVTDGAANYYVDKISVPRTALVANTNFYVATTGSDSNLGTSGNPWLTIQHAINTLATKYDLAGFNAIINVADGTYAGSVNITLPWVGGGPANVIIDGDSGTPSSVIVTGGISAFGTGAGISIENLEITTNQTVASEGGTLIFGPGMIFGNCGTSDHMVASYNSLIVVNNNYTISGNAASHMFVESSSTILIAAGTTVTLSGTPAFSQEFALALAGGTINVSGTTWSGSATGTRYLANAGGIIYTGNAGASFLPGNASGSAINGGIYY